ncbi:MAG: superoxide dismutase family protein [Sphingomonadales bacterium]|nr:superoxide dismutase family protein [Sphingomonadales bacterium]
MSYRCLMIATLALTGCTTLGQVPTQRIASAELKLANGAPAGTALITAAGDKLTLSVAAIGLPEGMHGIHLHMVGTCDAPGFATAGGHLNPAGHQHGTLNPSGSHLGDLPNLEIGKAGVGALSAQLPGTRAEVEAALFDADGTALVIHSGPDDYKTDPSGNSGTRIACGVIKRS